jgi:hypothetical protein
VDGSVETTPELTLTHDEDVWLKVRLGPEHARRRAHLELAAEAKGARREAKTELSFWPLADKFAARALWAIGVLAQGRANAARIQVTRNSVEIAGLPDAFHGYTLLHITDLHADISLSAMRALPDVIRHLPYDACVITGDFRGRTHGPFDRWGGRPRRHQCATMRVVKTCNKGAAHEHRSGVFEGCSVRRKPGAPPQ